MVSAFYFDKGDFAPVQQDALVMEAAVFRKREAVLLAVCDGIGGLQEGEYASGYVTMRIRDWFYRDFLRHVRKRHSRRRMERDCVSMLYGCNRYLLCYGKSRGISLGTTMTMVLLQSGYFLGCPVFPWAVKYMVFHAGDSRAYLLGKGCRRLTGDDSCGRHGLRRCIGSFPWQGVQKKKGYLRGGEKILVCSDGFWRRLEQAEIIESLGKERGSLFFGQRGLTELQLEKRLRRLGQAGRERGERDNQAAAIWCAGGG